MPIYSYACASGHRFDRYLPLSRWDEKQVCECGAQSEKRITAPMVVTDLPGYRSPVDGRWIEGKRARREDLARNNCVPYEPSIKAEYMKRLNDDTERLGKKVEDVVEAEIHAMPARKRELLEQEMRSGADVEFTRA
jgi:putative FmdB family regulatory protein